MTAAQPDNAAPLDVPRQRPATLVFTQTVLALQSLAALFATLVVFGLGRAGEFDLDPGLIWGVGLGLMVALGYASGQQRKRWGRQLGWVLQLPMLVAGVLVPAIALIGGMFLVLWVTGLRLGSRIDRERAERELAETEAQGPADG
ncbi:MAG: DUF4233 domain-containing protein [Actinobacteria bacterium HGW-Actinobacteria-4]|nr:MAG: DUF4233 domain-containing protein [Actinobacteria bacterium HGW-Actinobacteria-4]